MKLLIYLAVWKRPEITEICFMGINRLRGLADIDALAVISEVDMIPICERYRIRWVMYKNDPLGEKKNFGMSECLKLNWDYLVEIGSDDLLKDEFLSVYKWKSDVMSLSDLIVVNSETGECKRISEGAAIGLGRTFSRRAIENSHPIWSDSKNKGLDHSSEWSLAKKGFLMAKYKCFEPVAIDLKSNVNIWKFADLRGVNYPIEMALMGLSDEELNAIECLITKNKLAVLTEG